jgi:hypothetical protein
MVKMLANSKRQAIHPTLRFFSNDLRAPNRYAPSIV